MGGANDAQMLMLPIMMDVFARRIVEAINPPTGNEAYASSGSPEDSPPKKGHDGDKFDGIQYVPKRRSSDASPVVEAPASPGKEGDGRPRVYRSPAKDAQSPTGTDAAPTVSGSQARVGTTYGSGGFDQGGGPPRRPGGDGDRPDPNQ